MVQAIVQAALEAEMTAALGAEKGERTSERLGYRTQNDHARLPQKSPFGLRRRKASQL